MTELEQFVKVFGTHTFPLMVQEYVRRYGGQDRALDAEESLMAAALQQALSATFSGK